MHDDGTAVENRCGCNDHNVESVFRMRPPAQTCQWTSTHNSALHAVRDSGGMGLVAAVSCRMFTGQDKRWGRVLPLCFTWLGSIQQVVARLSVYLLLRREKWKMAFCVRAEAVFFFFFLTTRPLRATEWTRAKYSQTLGQWHGRSVCMCIIWGSRQVRMNTSQLNLV